jgi:diguanylate cyclase
MAKPAPTRGSPVPVVVAVRRLLFSGRNSLPKGQSLPDDVWRFRHRCLGWLLRAHVAVVFTLGVVQGHGALHSGAEAGSIAICAVLAASQGRRQFAAAMTAVGLVLSSAVIVHQSGGLIEAHFHFFVMVGVLTLYQDWRPYLIAIGFVVAHHAVLGVVAPTEVFNHPAAVAHPLRWALIHGAFVLAASVASVVAWRLNEEQALKDSLTGLPNRRLFCDRVEHSLAREARRTGTIGVLFIDLDRFKDVNDTLGHPAGDQLLVSVAERLRVVLRPDDTAARFGGDEFALLVEDIGVDDLTEVAERVLGALSAPFVVKAKEVAVGASVGVALSTPGDTVDDLLRNADVAMYTAKRAGRGRHAFFQPDMQAEVTRRVESEEALRRAVDDGEFVLHYQPIYALASGRPSGLEALLRWRHPTRGLLAPGEFLASAEDTGAIVGIGTWALHEACRQMRSWTDRHPGHGLGLSVNLSPTQLLGDDIVDVVAAALATSGLRPERLTLEITEDVMVKGSATVLGRLHALKALGVTLAVDDFGTGYSSLAYLRRLPFDVLKIDKTFVDDVARGDDESALPRAIVKLGQTLGLVLVAEGVEHPDQVARLRALGCDLAQGYWFARPAPAEALDAAIRGAVPAALAPG